MKVVIIGNGIVGASAAYQLVKNNHEVVLVDREYEGAATLAGAGIVCPWISSVKDDDWYQLAKRGAGYYPQLIAELKEDGEEDVGYKKIGALCVRSNLEELRVIVKELIDKQKDAPEMGYIKRMSSL